MKESKFQFQNPMLREVEAISHPNWEFDEDYNIEVGLEIDSYTSKEDIDGSVDNALKNTAIVAATITVGNKADGAAPFFIRLKIEALFMWEDIDDVRLLLKRNAPSLLISYARPTIAFLTSQMGLPAYHLPYLDLSKM